MPVVQLAARAKSSTLYGHTVVQSYGRMVVRSYGRTVVRLYGHTVVWSYGCTVIQSYGCTVVQLYIQIFLARWVTTILKYIDLAPLWSNAQNTFNYAFYMNSILFFIICTICNEDLSQLFLLKSSLILLSSKFSPCYLWCSATLFIL